MADNPYAWGGPSAAAMTTGAGPNPFLRAPAAALFERLGGAVGQGAIPQEFLRPGAVVPQAVASTRRAAVPTTGARGSATVASTRAAAPGPSLTQTLTGAALSGLSAASSGALGTLGAKLPGALPEALTNMTAGSNPFTTGLTGALTGLAAGDNKYAQVGNTVGSLFGPVGSIVGTLAGGLVSSIASPGRNNFEGGVTASGQPVITKMPGGRGGMLLAQQGVTLEDANKFLAPALSAYATTGDASAAKATLGTPSNPKDAAILKYWDQLSSGANNIFSSLDRARG